MDDDNFYGQIASSMADNSFDDSDEDNKVKPTQAETKQLAQSVDVDDMDASLFSSLSSGPIRRGPRRGSRSRATPIKQPEMGAVSVGASSEGVRKGREGGRPLTSGKDVVDKPKEEVQKKKPKFDFENEILDLLSDDEDVASQTRTKPKIQLTAKKSKIQEPSMADSKPITYPTEGHTCSDMERPSTSRGLSKTQPKVDPIAMEIPTLVPVKEGNADILKVEATTKKTNDSKSTVTFDDDDDILGGLGFEEEKPSSKSRLTKRASSRLDDLLGKSLSGSVQAKQSTTTPTPKPVDTESKTTPSSKVVETGPTNTEEDEDGFQFGGYLPSSVDSSSGPPKRGSLKLPSGRRRGSPELDSGVTDRPSTAPSPVRKSVHFAENLETSERPASSSAVTESKRSSLKASEKATHPSKKAPPPDSVKQPLNSGEDGGGRLPLCRKPPLPLKVDLPTENGDKATLNESLFSFDTEVPKQPASQGRRRPTSRSGSTLFASESDLFEGKPESGLFEDNSRNNSRSRLVENKPGNDSESDVFTSTGGSGPVDELPSFREPNKSKDIEKLEHPVFPWQKSEKGSTHSRPSSKRQSTPSIEPDTVQSQHQITQQVPPTNPINPSSLDQSAALSSFQEQLLQQQKLLQEQLAGFQAQSSSAIATAQASCAAELERVRGELEGATGRVRELEEMVERKNSEVSTKQASLQDLEQRFTAAEESKHQLEDQCKELTRRVNTADRELAQVKQGLNTQIEELKVKLCKVELERDQLQHAAKAVKERHSEELEAVQKSHESRAKAMEESIQRRETRWKEETATDAARFQEKLALLEQEKMDTVLALKKKIDALEVSKTNEIGRLKDLHYSAIEDLKREHELDKQQLIGLHRQEVEAIKAAHSHTRMLSDLSHKVEASTRDMTHLQVKLEHAHSTELDERMQRVKSHEEHLKVLEVQLLRQKSETSAEREQLQTLIAKMESHISQQKKQLEQEKWQLQQDSAKLTARQTAFEEERVSSLMKLETERERLEQAKEKFLSEQQEILSQCYEERRAIASERAELTVQQKRASEREQRGKQLSIQSEAEREALSARLREEREQLAEERTRLRQEQEQLRLDRETVDRDKERLEAYGAEIQQRSLEIEQITETALLVREKGDQSLAESQRLQEELSQQAQAIQAQREELAEKEKQLSLEQLSLAQERRKLQHLKMTSLGSSVPEAPSDETVNSATNSLFVTRDALDPQEPLSSVSTTSLSSYKGGVSGGLSLSASANRSYSPRASPLCVSALSSGPHNMKSVLARIDQSRSLRQFALDAKKDEECLEQETNFLQSLQPSTYIY